MKNESSYWTKVNRRYLKMTPSLTDYKKLIIKIHEVQSLVQEIVPRSLDLTVEVCNDCTFINDEHGRPIGAMNAGQGLPEEMLELFALELQTMVSAKRHSWQN